MGKIRKGTLRRGEKADAARAEKRRHGQRGPDKGTRNPPAEAVRLRAKGFATAREVAEAEGVALSTVRRRLRDKLIPGRALEAVSMLGRRERSNSHWYVHLPGYFAIIPKDNPVREPIELLAAQLGIRLDGGKTPARS